MAMDIINAKKVTENGLLSKIKIGGKIYEIKDLIARESIEELADLIDALTAKVGEVGEDENLAALIAALQKAVEDLGNNKADKTQVAADIEAAVKAEADIARAAEKANADEIARVEGELDGRLDKVELFFEGAAEDGEGLQNALDTLKEIQDFINVEGTTADAMIKDIAANKKAIEDEAKARDDADKAFDERLDDVEALLTGGEGSVGEQIEAAKDAAIEAANEYTDGEIDKVEAELAKKEDKANLKALAYKDSGSVAGETISGVKATGTGVTGVSLSDTAVEKDLTANGTFTPAGTVAVDNIVIPEHSVPVTITNNDAQAVLATGTGTSNATVNVVPATGKFMTGINHGELPTFVEGTFHKATLGYEAVEKSYAKEGIVGEVEEECLIFTNAGVEALSASKINSFDGGSKDADTFTAGTECTAVTADAVVGIDSANASIEYEKVTGVTYKKAEENASGACAGSTIAVSATFTGSEGAVNVGGKYTDTNYTAAANTGNIELAVGDIKVAAKDVAFQ